MPVLQSTQFDEGFLAGIAARECPDAWAKVVELNRELRATRAQRDVFRAQNDTALVASVRWEQGAERWRRVALAVGPVAVVLTYAVFRMLHGACL